MFFLLLAVQGSSLLQEGGCLLESLLKACQGAGGHGRELVRRLVPPRELGWWPCEGAWAWSEDLAEILRAIFGEKDK